MAKKDRKFILLTFDVEEFDIPLDYNIDISLNDQLRIGYQGLVNIMDLLSKYPDIKATFFTTAIFAKRFPEIIRQLSLNHEIASHTYSNFYMNAGDLLLSRRILEEIISKPVPGIRMPQMQHVDVADLIRAGYSYDSSVNPTWLPGRYNNFNKPVSFYLENGILRIPASVSGMLRIPLFWLSFKNMPLYIYKSLAYLSLRKQGYLNLYFHPWEFTDLSEYPVPRYFKTGSSKRLLKKMDRFLKDTTPNAGFITISEFIDIKTREEIQNYSSIRSHL
jgi:hypothetical protein